MYDKHLKLFTNKNFLYRKYDILLDSLKKTISAIKKMKGEGYSDVQILKGDIFCQGGKIVKVDDYSDEHNFVYAVFLLTNWEVVDLLKNTLKKVYNYISVVFQQNGKTDIADLEQRLFEGYHKYMIEGDTSIMKKLINSFITIFEKYDVPYLKTIIDKETGEKKVLTVKKDNTKYFDYMREEIKDMIQSMYDINFAEEKYYKDVLKRFKKNKYLDFSFKMEINGEGTTFRGVLDITGKTISVTIRRIGKPLEANDLFNYCDEDFRKVITDMFIKKEGLLLVSGPTGSGKTTFLISMLEHLNQKDTWNKVVLTVEDPVEYFFENKNYTFLQKNIGEDINTFKDGIKVALRKHPDIIMVGETRDPETVEGILSASETGHLTISTLHLTHPWDVITRISSLAVKDKLVLDQLSKSLIGIVNIGLLHVEKPVQEEYEENGEKKIKIRKQKFVVPYYEVLRVDPTMASFIKRGDVDSIKQQFKNVEMIEKKVCYPRELYLLRLHNKMPEIFTKEHLDRICDTDMLEEMTLKYKHVYKNG